MEYTVAQLAEMAGVSRRTLRYYDQIGLLHPQRAQNGYRYYTAREADRLQQVLFYRALGLPLEEIGAVLDSPGFDRLAALQSHLEKLTQKRRQIDTLIHNAQMSIRHLKGEIEMSDKEKFEGFKSRMIEQNEAKYGEEIREKYGDETVDASNRKLKNMTQQEYDQQEALSLELNEALRQALETGDPAGEKAWQAAALHKKWLLFYWDAYTPEAHRGLGQMYVDDERFKAYYEKIAPGAAEFLRDAILNYTGG